MANGGTTAPVEQAPVELEVPVALALLAWAAVPAVGEETGTSTAVVVAAVAVVAGHRKCGAVHSAWLTPSLSPMAAAAAAAEVVAASALVALGVMAARVARRA